MSKQDILYLDLDETDGQPEPRTFLSTPTAETAPKLAPDGRFLAYVSDESGRAEVYVRPFPSGSGKWQVLTSGGTQPRWCDDGQELYYVENSELLVVVPVVAGQSLTLGTPQPSFKSADLHFRGHP